MITDQLLYLIHRRLEHEMGSQWTRRPIPRLVDMIGRIYMVGITLRDLVVAIHAKQDDSWSRIEDVLEEYAQVQDEVELQVEEEWDEICRWAGHPTITRTLKALERRYKTRKEQDIESKRSNVAAMAKDTTVTIRNKPKEGRPRISK